MEVAEIETEKIEKKPLTDNKKRPLKPVNFTKNTCFRKT